MARELDIAYMQLATSNFNCTMVQLNQARRTGLSSWTRRENKTMTELTVAERAMPELTDDMTVTDLVDVLEHLRFAGGQTSMLRIDRGVRDYLVRMLKGR